MKKTIAGMIFLMWTCSSLQAQTTTPDGSSNGGSSGTSGSTHGSTNNTNGTGSKSGTYQSDKNLNNGSSTAAPSTSSQTQDVRDNMNTNVQDNKTGNTMTTDGSVMHHNKSTTGSGQKRHTHKKAVSPGITSNKSTSTPTTPQ